MTNNMPRVLKTLVCIGIITAVKHNIKTDFIIMAWIIRENLNYVSIFYVEKAGKLFREFSNKWLK